MIKYVTINLCNYIFTLFESKKDESMQLFIICISMKEDPLCYVYVCILLLTSQKIFGGIFKIVKSNS